LGRSMVLRIIYSFFFFFFPLKEKKKKKKKKNLPPPKARFRFAPRFDSPWHSRACWTPWSVFRDGSVRSASPTPWDVSRLFISITLRKCAIHEGFLHHSRPQLLRFRSSKIALQCAHLRMSTAAPLKGSHPCLLLNLRHLSP
jgi:hypothetical protein